MQASARYAAGTWGRGPLPHARSVKGEHRHSINSAPDRRASVPFTPPFHTAAIPQPSTIPVQLSQLAPCQMPSSPHWRQSNARPQRIASMMDAIGPLMPGGLPAAGFAARDFRPPAATAAACRCAARARPRTTICHPLVGAAAADASSGPETSMTVPATCHFFAAMRAAADQRAAAAVEMHGLARLFGDGDVCRGLRRLLDIELAAAARRKQLAHQAGQGGEAGQGAEAGQVRPTRAQRRRAQRKRCAQRMRSGCGFDSGSSGGTGCGLKEQGASKDGPLEAKMQQPNAAQDAEQQRGALVVIDPD